MTISLVMPQRLPNGPWSSVPLIPAVVDLPQTRASQDVTAMYTMGQLIHRPQQ